jgi:hypothetical protein
MPPKQPKSKPRDLDQVEDLCDRLFLPRLASLAATARFARAILCSDVIFAAAVLPPLEPPMAPPFAPCLRNHSRTSAGNFLAITSMLALVY